MLEFLSVIKSHPRRSLLVVAGITVSSLAIRAIWNKLSARRRTNKQAIWRLSGTCEIDSRTLFMMIGRLERLLAELEGQKFCSEICRGKYDLMASIIARLQSVCSDLQKYLLEDFQKVSMEDIAKTIWSKKTTLKTGTLSVLSDDSFISAFDEFVPAQQNELLSADFANLDLYKAGLKAFERGEIFYRKSRTEFCQCDSEQDFASKIYSIRLAFDFIVSDPHNVHWLMQSGRNLLAAILRQDKRDTSDFYTVYDRMMAFLSDPKNYEMIKEDLRLRRVVKTNLWDVLFDLVILDAFEDLQKPPSTIMALMNNSFISCSMKESTINNLIWSLIKVKRTRLKIKDGFISHFYDISQILTCSLTMGLLGGSSREFQTLCIGFKENLLQFVVDIFNLNKVRYTTPSELAEDVKRLLEDRIETIQVMLNSEPIPDS